MPNATQHQDLLHQIRRLQEQVRRLQVKRRAVTSQTKTFIAGGVIEAGFAFPPFIISTQPSYEEFPAGNPYPQDVRILTGVGAVLGAGSCQLDFEVNNTPIYSGLAVTTSPQTFWQPLAEDVLLQDGDRLSVTVVDATDTPVGLSAAFLMTLETWD